MAPGHSVLGGGVSLVVGGVLGAVALARPLPCTRGHGQGVGLGRVRLAGAPVTRVDQGVDLASGGGLDCVMVVLGEHHSLHARPVHPGSVLEGGGGLDVLGGVVVVGGLGGVRGTAGYELTVLRLVMVVSRDLVKSVRVRRGGGGRPVHSDSKTITTTI